MIDWVDINKDFISTRVEEAVNAVTTAFLFLKNNMDSIITVAEIALGALVAFKVASGIATAINILTTAMAALEVVLVVISGPIAVVVAGLVAPAGT